MQCPWSGSCCSLGDCAYHFARALAAPLLHHLARQPVLHLIKRAKKKTHTHIHWDKGGVLIGLNLQQNHSGRHLCVCVCVSARAQDLLLSASSLSSHLSGSTRYRQLSASDRLLSLTDRAAPDYFAAGSDAFIFKSPLSPRLRFTQVGQVISTCYPLSVPQQTP